MIVDVRTRRISAALHTPFVTALRSTTTVDTVVVEVVDSDGNIGVGEAPQVWQVTGESLQGSQACIDGPLRAMVMGSHPDDLIPTLDRVMGAVAGNGGAKSAVDVALHDLAARRRGVSLPVFLGSNNHEVRTDVTLSVGDIEVLADTTRARLADGFRVLKMKVGTDARVDVERVRVVRQTVGPDVVIRLDANQGWSPREAVNAVRAMEDERLDVELVEQPVRASDLRGLQWVTDRVATPILADESVYSVHDLGEVIRRRAADMVNVKLAKCGGLRNARTMLDVSHAHGVGCIVGTMMETQIGVGAAASLVAAYGTSAVSDLDAAWWLAESPYTGGLHYEKDRIVLPSLPGLGVGVPRA